MTLYYHVSTALTHDGIFTPRVPESRYTREDCQTPRVCVSPSIEDALTAIPNGGSRLDQLMEQQFGYLKIFTIDTEKLNIRPSEIIHTDDLFMQNLVGDADNTNEVWITVPFTVPKEDQTIIAVTDWDEESYDVVPHHIYVKSEDEYEGDYIQCYMDEYDEHVPCGTAIKNLTYHPVALKKGDVIPLLYEYDTALTDWESLKDAYELPIKPFIRNVSLFIQAIDTIDLSDYIVKHVRQYG